MQVIAGQYKRRILKTLDGLSTRPMLGRMRQVLFDILQNDIQGMVFADLYAGSGAVGIEALSRGAERVIFIESNYKAAEIIRSNLKMLGALDRAQIRMAPTQNVIPDIEADIFFLGPPYEAVQEYEKSLAALSVKQSKYVIAQHAHKLSLQENYDILKQFRVVSVGKHRLSMYRHGPEDS